MKRQHLLILILSLAVFGAAAAVSVVPPLFITSARCQACHNGLTSPDGTDISIGTDWRASMMANAARDPYWHAAIRRETLANPKIAEAAEHECSACHMPMDHFQAQAGGGRGRVFAHLPIVPFKGLPSASAVDGVSCTVCHQITSEKLGQKDSFTAGFVVERTTPVTGRRIFGPYDIDAGRRTAMQSSSGFAPEKAAHIRSSELCATCHTLYTHAHDAKGESVGRLPEQVPYLEWKHSGYPGKKECISCHMPEIAGRTAISSTLGQPRENSARHVFRGGNFFLPKIFNRHREALGVAAEPAELDAVSSRAADHLRTSAAHVALGGLQVEDGHVRGEISVGNMAGHKLPTAYPSRRAWIHLTVADGSGAVVFESGRLNPDGSIAGNDNDEDPGRFEPHHAEILRPEDVQIYEPILGDPDGRVTTVLLAATRYLKDNRILPFGFDKATADGDIAVYGEAADDPDFRAGGDRVRFRVPLGASAGPFTVRAELWYQPIGHRWARNVGDRPSAEADLFLSYYAPLAGVSGLVLARAEMRTGS